MKNVGIYKIEQKRRLCYIVRCPNVVFQPAFDVKLCKINLSVQKLREVSFYVLRGL